MHLKSWRNIGKGWHYLQNSNVWALGNGQSAKFWEDDWWGRGALREHFQGPLNCHEHSLTVRDLRGDNGWEFQRISFDIPLHIKTVLNTISLQDREDIPCSNFVNSKGFSLSLAYKHILRSPQEVNIEWLWKANTLPKIKMFLWLVWNDRLPHKKLLFDRNIVHDHWCSRCNLNSEHSLHILRDCTFTSEIWRLISPATQNSTDTLQVWIKDNMQMSHMVRGMEWKYLFPFICFELWKYRNDFVFKNIFHRMPFKTLHAALNNAKAFASAQSSHTPVSLGTPSNRMTHPAGWTQIHVDASFTNPFQVTGIACCVRNDDGTWVLGSSQNIMTPNSVMGELYSIKLGLQMAEQRRIQRFILYTDCTAAYDLIREGSHFNSIYTHLIDDCRQLLRTCDQGQIQKMKRDDNKLADALAKNQRKASSSSSSNISTPKLFNQPPVAVLDIYNSECRVD